jgi:hypothetical protein
MVADWEAWKFLLGEWEGGHTGDPRVGTGTFSFEFDLAEDILVRKSRTVFPPTQDRQGYAHEDLLVIYNEHTGEKRAIYFDNEQHVIHYAVQVSTDGDSLTLESDIMPAVPQFRFTYTKSGENQVSARFEMTRPGQPGAYFTYLEGIARRINR